MFLGQRIDQSQPQSGSGYRILPGFAGAGEGLQNTLLFVFGDARPGIGHPHTDFFPGANFRADRDLAAFRCEFYRVGGEIYNGLLDLAFITIEIGQVIGNRQGELDVFGQDIGLDEVRGFPDQVGNIDNFLVELRAAVLDFRQVQNVVDQAEKMGRAGVDVGRGVVIGCC